MNGLRRGPPGTAKAKTAARDRRRVNRRRCGTVSLYERARRGGSGDGQRGAALLLVVLLAAAAAVLSAALLARAGAVAREVRARQDALCARYAALSGLAINAVVTDPSAAAALVANEVFSLTTALVRRGPSWCVLRATARCGQATRTLERTLEDPARCNQ